MRLNATVLHQHEPASRISSLLGPAYPVSPKPKEFMINTVGGEDMRRCTQEF